jgi:C4-dicarboxylate-binding protein DctP
VLVIWASCSPAAAVGGLDLTIATAHAPTVPWVYVIRDYVVPEFKAQMAEQLPDTPVAWTEAYGTLYKWHNSLDGIEIGLADVGWVGSLWESARLPLQNITYALPFITDDLMTLVQVVNRLHDAIPALRESWARYNAHFLGVSGVDSYHLMTNFPVRTLDDLKGRKILAPGAAAIWLKGTGAIAVDGALSTYYTQLKTGVADGVVSILTGVYPFRIHEVAPYVTFVGIGAQCTGALTVNLDVWRRLPAAARDILARLGREYSARSAAEVIDRYAAAYDGLERDGAIFATLPAAEKQRWIDGLPDLGRAWVQRNEAKGLPAGAVLRGLMDGLRASGVVPMEDWDRRIDP